MSAKKEKKKTSLYKMATQPPPYDPNMPPPGGYPPPGAYPPQPMQPMATQPVSYVVQPGATTIVTTNYGDPSDQDFIISLLIFIFGWFLCCVWCGGFAFIKSKNNGARIFAILSIVMMAVGTVTAIIVIGIEIAFAVAAASAATAAVNAARTQ